MPLSGLKILAVDDDLDSADLLCVLLEDLGAEVLVADSVAQAIVLATHHPPHLLISDIRLPQEDGYALLNRLRNLATVGDRPLPAIALSASAMEQDQKRALCSGYQRYFSKPVDLDMLLGAIADLTGRSTCIAS